jgi:glycosyltransferase 2 family protein
MNIKNILKYLVSVVLAGGLLWFTFKQSHLDVAELGRKIAEADYRWVLLSALLTIVAHWSRGQRWRLLLEPVGHRPSPLNATVAVLTGYLANLALPRAGEVARCGTLYRLDAVPINVSFGTVVAERLFDVLMLALLLGATFLLEFDRLSGFFMGFLGAKVPGAAGSGNSGLLLVIGAVLVGGAVLAWLLYRRYRAALEAWPVYQKMLTFAKGLLDGLLSVRKLKQPGMFVFHTLLIWTLYYFMSYTLFLALPGTRNLGPLAGLTILVVGALGMTAPTPGGIGSFHLLVGQVLLLYGLTAQDGQILATFIHGVSTIMIILLGVASFVYVLIKGQNTPKTTGISTETDTLQPR